MLSSFVFSVLGEKKHPWTVEELSPGTSDGRRPYDNLSWIISTVACGIFQYNRDKKFVVDALTAFITSRDYTKNSVPYRIF